MFFLFRDSGLFVPDKLCIHCLFTNHIKNLSRREKRNKWNNIDANKIPCVFIDTYLFEFHHLKTVTWQLIDARLLIIIVATIDTFIDTLFTTLSSKTNFYLFRRFSLFLGWVHCFFFDTLLLDDTLDLYPQRSSVWYARPPHTFVVVLIVVVSPQSSSSPISFPLRC